MKYRLIIGFCFLFTFQMHGQEDEEVIKKNFTSTLAKLSLYYTEVLQPKVAVATAKYGGTAALAKSSVIRNPSFKNVKDVVTSNLLPEYSQQGSYLSTVFDQELMRDIDQYVKYTKTFLNYGMLMTSSEGIDTAIRETLSPEKLVDDGEEIEVEGVAAPVELIGGLTELEYSENINAVQNELANYVYTGDDVVDYEAQKDIIASYFEDEQERSNVMWLMQEFDEAEYTGDEDDDKAMIEGIYEEYDEMLAEQALLKEEIAAEEEAAITYANGDAQWDNELNMVMQDMGMGNRNPVDRYGSVAEEPYNRRQNIFNKSMEEAQIHLTNVVDAWDKIKKAGYIEKGIELEKIGSEILENGFDTEKLTNLKGEFKALWDGIRSIVRKNPD